MKQTQIIATLGPVSDSPEMIEQLVKAGANIFRFNMKHADRDWHNERIARVREVCSQKGIRAGILIDLQGPEVRLETPEKQEVSVTQGETILFSLNPLADQKHVVIPTPAVFTAVTASQPLLIDDGVSEYEITEVTPTLIKAVAKQDGVIKHRKSVNFPGASIDLPSMTEDDYRKLDMSNMAEVDFVALSFTRTKEDIAILQAELDKRGSKAKIVSKLENQAALDNLEEVVLNSGAVMIARGDMAVEIPFERLAYEQKRIIRLCREKGIPVITATQMLHSMVHNPRPTRAEICDVSNAVYDGTDVTMLSEETAGGQFPLKAVETMAKIIGYTEGVVASREWTPMYQ